MLRLRDRGVTAHPAPMAKAALDDIHTWLNGHLNPARQPRDIPAGVFDPESLSAQRPTTLTTGQGTHPEHNSLAQDTIRSVGSHQL